MYYRNPSPYSLVTAVYLNTPFMRIVHEDYPNASVPFEGTQAQAQHEVETLNHKVRVRLAREGRLAPEVS